MAAVQDELEACCVSREGPTAQIQRYLLVVAFRPFRKRISYFRWRPPRRGGDPHR